MADDDSTTLKRAKKSKHKKKRQRDNDEDRKAKKKHKKEKKKLKKESIDDGDDTSVTAKKAKKAAKKAKKEKKRKQKELDEKIVSSSAIEFYPDGLKTLQLAKNQEDEKQKAAAAVAEAKAAAAAEEKGQSAANSANNITLLLFYQYVEPCWDDDQFQVALKFVTDQGNKYGLTGRMRVAKEGLNCTLTGSHDGIRNWCAALRTFDGGRSKIDQVTGETITEFAKTEFKLTDDLPPKQRFPKLHAFEVVEIVNYGLAGNRAPEIAKYGGTHLEPEDYNNKMCEKDTVIIDVRNHYEANIGRFNPPEGGAKMIDPMMRKSTEFPIWLDKPETKEMLRGKQVLMYCTGGVRCERASALLKQKIETEDDTKSLGIKGVYQLQGGIDKYFKQFPEGGLWKGKNYVFDKRFSHAPPKVEAVDRTKKVLGDDEVAKVENVVDGIPSSAADEILGACEGCSKPWDMYRGKRRCPTCGVPSLICRECFDKDKFGVKKLGRDVRCDLCITEDVRNKQQLREREEREMKEYENNIKQKLGEKYEPYMQRKHAITRKPKANPERITRLFLKNMCAKQMDEEKLLEFLHPAKVTHIQWLTDRNTGAFYGSAFIEVKTAEDAGSVLAANGMTVLGRRMTVKYQKPDEKSIWPVPGTEVGVE
mmetsp:Transcript_30375/g.60955  ORF Transcript_30375/g.60955 Transcript_30375/m.60955 type:complete len:648 (+) Transcript_30375:166-2109(+)